MTEIKEHLKYVLILIIALILLHLWLTSCEMPKAQEDNYYSKQAYAQEAVRTAHLLIK